MVKIVTISVSRRRSSTRKAPSVILDPEKEALHRSASRTFWKNMRLLVFSKDGGTRVLDALTAVTRDDLETMRLATGNRHFFRIRV